MAYRDPEEGRARDQERLRRCTAERIARGLCPRCGKAPPAPDRTLCRRCAENRRAAERARYAKARAAGRLYGGRDPRAATQRARQDQAALRRPPRGRPVHPVRLAPAGRGRHGLRAVPRPETRGRTRTVGRAAGRRPVRHMRGDHVRRRFALRSRRTGRRGTPPAASATPGGGRASSAPTAARRPRARPGVRRARTAPMCARPGIVACRRSRRATGHRGRDGRGPRDVREPGRGGGLPRVRAALTPRGRDRRAPAPAGAHGRQEQEKGLEKVNGKGVERDRTRSSTQRQQPGSTITDFEAARRFVTCCLRFTTRVATRHARLAFGWRAAPLPGGCRTRRIATRGFRSSHPPLQGFARRNICSSIL